MKEANDGLAVVPVGQVRRKVLVNIGEFFCWIEIESMYYEGGVGMNITTRVENDRIIEQHVWLRGTDDKNRRHHFIPHPYAQGVYLHVACDLHPTAPPVVGLAMDDIEDMSGDWW